MKSPYRENQAKPLPDAKPQKRVRDSGYPSYYREPPIGEVIDDLIIVLTLLGVPAAGIIAIIIAFVHRFLW